MAHDFADASTCETYPSRGAPVYEVTVIHGDFVFFADRGVRCLRIMPHELKFLHLMTGWLRPVNTLPGPSRAVREEQLGL